MHFFFQRKNKKKILESLFLYFKIRALIFFFFWFSPCIPIKIKMTGFSICIIHIFFLTTTIKLQLNEPVKRNLYLFILDIYLLFLFLITLDPRTQAQFFFISKPCVSFFWFSCFWPKVVTGWVGTKSKLSTVIFWLIVKSAYI